MNVFTRSISQILIGSFQAFQRFPAAIASALGFAIVTMIRIQLDWPEQEAYNFLLNCLHWSLAFGAVFSLAVITGAQSRYNERRAFLIANLIGAAAVVVTFLALYLLGEAHPAGSSFTTISSLAVFRVGAAILVSLLAFIILASYPTEQSDFSRAFFMTQKAFFIALLYGLVIMAGSAGVAGAIQALLYNGMSEKVYMYLSTLSGFLAFTIFVGYFPDFRKGQVDERREVAQKQPRFVEILFEYIMIPLMLALTVVLLLWAGKTILSDTRVAFSQLAGIVAAFTGFGIWLHIMVSQYETGLARFYRRIYPLAALVILAFEAWALVIQLQKTGLKTTEYFFIVIWIVALASAIMLIVRQAKAHRAIAMLVCVMAVITVMPLIGYHDLPVSVQANRLEKLLVDQGMLKGDQLSPAATEPELAVRESITDAVYYLASAEDAKLPSWFDKNLIQGTSFKAKFGFEPTWPEPEGALGNGFNYQVISLVLQPEAIDISDYRWTVDMQQFVDHGKGQSAVTLNGDKGSYRIYWFVDTTGMPKLRIEMGDRVILEENMSAYVDRVAKAYPPNQGLSTQAPLKDMSLQLDTPEMTVLLVFSNVEIRLDPGMDSINYWVNLSAMYLNEKP